MAAGGSRLTRSQFTPATYGTGRETTLDLASRYGFYTDNNPNDATLDLSSAVWTTTLEDDENILVNASGTMKDALALRAHLKRIERRNNRGECR